MQPWHPDNAGFIAGELAKLQITDKSQYENLKKHYDDKMAAHLNVETKSTEELEDAGEVGTEEIAQLTEAEFRLLTASEQKALIEDKEGDKSNADKRTALYFSSPSL